MSKEIDKMIEELKYDTELTKKMIEKMDSEALIFIEHLKTVRDCAKEMAEMVWAVECFEDDVPSCSVAEEKWDKGIISGEELDEFYDHHATMCQELHEAEGLCNLFHDIVVNINKVIDTVNSVPMWESTIESIDYKF